MSTSNDFEGLNENEQWLVAKLADEGMLAGVMQEALSLLALDAGPLCGKPFPGILAGGPPITCDLTRGHGGGRTRCYDREARVHFWPDVED